MPLPVGAKAPNFTLPSTNGKKFTLSIDMLLKPCILYFYPKDFSMGCTNEACSFRNTFDFFLDLNISIVGISRDSMESHLKFKKTLNLPFELLSDEDGKVCAAYETQLPFLPLFTKRTTYLLNKDHEILAAYENVFSSARHIKTMIEKVTASKDKLVQ